MLLLRTLGLSQAKCCYLGCVDTTHALSAHSAYLEVGTHYWTLLTRSRGGRLREERVRGGTYGAVAGHYSPAWALYMIRLGTHRLRSLTLQRTCIRTSARYIGVHIISFLRHDECSLRCVIG